jgi:predicted DNA-binding transcriptional regulator AlpA
VEINMKKTLLDEREVSIVTGVPTKTLQYCRFAGTSHAPKFIKLGTRVYYRWQDLEKWVAERPSFSSATQAKHQGTG